MKYVRLNNVAQSNNTQPWVVNGSNSTRTAGAEDSSENGYSNHVPLHNHTGRETQGSIVRKIAHKIILPVSNGVHVIPITDILHCKASGNYAVVILTTGKEIVVSKTLKWLIQLLPDSQFIRVHQSHLVRINAISFAGNDFVLLDGVIRIPVSRRISKALRHELSQFSLS
jgi:DNA-binding LytR/AlgR family response regulator